MDNKQVKPGEGTLILSPLRDQFAMAALTGLCAHGGGDDDYSVAAYELADAMLAERDKVR